MGLEHRVALLAKPGAGFAVMDAPGWYEDYMKIAVSSPSWVNSMPARGLFAAANYNPIDTADKISCPVLIINGARDQAVAAEDVRATAAKIANCKQVELDFDHFDLYEGFELHAEAVRLEVQFLREIAGA